jgi:hypothetical protein
MYAALCRTAYPHTWHEWHESDILFPNRPDLLVVTVQLPDESATFVVMVHHFTAVFAFIGLVAV